MNTKFGASLFLLVAILVGQDLSALRSSDLQLVPQCEAEKVTGGQLICKCVQVTDKCNVARNIIGKGWEGCPGSVKYTRVTCPEHLTGGTGALFTAECTTPCGVPCGEHTVNWASCTQQ